MLKKVQADFQLSIVVLFGICAAVVVLPFALYRFMSGSFMAGVLDTAIVFLIVSFVVFALRSGKIELAGKVIVIINCIGVILSTELLGFTGIFWSYAAILSNFFLTRSQRFAAVLTLLTISCIPFSKVSFVTTTHMWSFLMTSYLLALLSGIVAYQYDKQKCRLELLAATDPLTGAFNRRVMEQELHIAVAEHARKGTPMAVILMDIDHFKRVNDLYGHDKGDFVLSAFAESIKQNTRQNDRFFRYGGEEFLMLVKNAKPEEAAAIAEKIRHTTENSAESGPGKLTVSLGIASIEKGESCEHWVARADAAMYRAKQLGRNRVEL